MRSQLPRRGCTGPPAVSGEGQGSVEIIFVLAIIIIVSFLVVGKFFSEEGNVFTRASARQVMVGELEKLDKKYYLVKVESTECQGGEIRIIFFINPSPVSGGDVDSGVAAIKPKVEKLVKDTVGGNKTIMIGYNRPENLVCKKSDGSPNPFIYP